MKNIKNKLVVYMIIFAFIFSSGCTQMESGDESQQTGNTEELEASSSKAGKTNIQIALWSLGYQKGLEDALAEFNRENEDDIEVTLLQLSKFKYTEILNMLMTSGDGPDIFGINSEWLDTYINRNWALNISRYIDADFLKDFPGWAVMFARNPAFRGNFYTIPATMITSRLIYNKDLFKMVGLDPEKPPVTLEELEEYALKISNAGIGIRKYGLALPLGDEWAGFVQSMEMPFTYSGVYYYNFKEGSYNLNVYKKWFRTIIDLKNKGCLYPGENTIKIDTIRAQFAEGNIGMMFASSWDPSALQNQYSIRCDWGVAMPPALDRTSIGKGRVMVLPGVCYVVNSDSPNKDKVMKVWKYLYSRECLGEQYRQGGEIPVPGGITSAPEFKPDIENYAEFLPGENDSPYPNTPIGGSEWERFKVYLETFEKGETGGIALHYESAKLNESFRSRVLRNVIDINDYMGSSFDPLRPLE